VSGHSALKEVAPTDMCSGLIELILYHWQVLQGQFGSIKKYSVHPDVIKGTNDLRSVI